MKQMGSHSFFISVSRATMTMRNRNECSPEEALANFSDHSLWEQGGSLLS